MELVLKPDRQSQHMVTVPKIGLFEEAHAEIDRVHCCVVAELRVMPRRHIQLLWASLLSYRDGLYCILAHVDVSAVGVHSER